MRNLAIVLPLSPYFPKISAFQCYWWKYQNAEIWLNFKKFQLKGKVWKHFTRPKQRVALRKLFRLPPVESYLYVSGTKIPLPTIYLSSFTNVRCWTEIEFSNFVKCRWGSRSALKLRNGCMAECVQGVKPLKIFGIFTSGGQINNSK